MSDTTATVIRGVSASGDSNSVSRTGRRPLLRAFDRRSGSASARRRRLDRRPGAGDVRTRHLGDQIRILAASAGERPPSSPRRVTWPTPCSSHSTAASASRSPSASNRSAVTEPGWEAFSPRVIRSRRFSTRTETAAVPSRYVVVDCSRDTASQLRPIGFVVLSVDSSKPVATYRHVLEYALNGPLSRFSSSTITRGGSTLHSSRRTSVR